MDLLQAGNALIKVSFPGYTFRVHGDFTPGTVTYLQASFMAPDSSAPGQPMEQKTRKWLLSAHMTDSELVQTAFKCVLTAMEHEVREQFTFMGNAIFGPHFNVDVLAAVCGVEGTLEVRL